MQVAYEDIYIWPDGTWCWHSQLEECESGRSDDYEVVTLPEDVYISDDVDCIDNWIFKHLQRQGE